MLTPEAGRQIQKAREDADMSQLVLAVASKVSIATISEIENGHNRNPRRRTLERILEALGLDVADLVDFEEEEGAA